MEIFCEKCQKNVGKIADEKIPVGKKVSISCPKCGDKIYFARPAEMSGSAGTGAQKEPKKPSPAIGGKPAPGSAALAGGPGRWFSLRVRRGSRRLAQHP